jgi:alkylation response protein AidB-like acyl-CoA dehydrogenase
LPSRPRRRSNRADADGLRGAQRADRGALQAILDMTVRYANERVAFERPIAKFQAVQHNLARLAGEVSAA